jgi:hypothetical protein
VVYAGLDKEMIGGSHLTVGQTTNSIYDGARSRFHNKY